MKALALLSTLQSADIVLPTTDGREIRLRRITEPTAEQKSLLQQLGLSLPERFELNRKCSVDSEPKPAGDCGASPPGLQILMHTVPRQATDRLTVFEAGANDHVTKPCPIKAARLKAARSTMLALTGRKPKSRSGICEVFTLDLYLKETVSPLGWTNERTAVASRSPRLDLKKP